MHLQGGHRFHLDRRLYNVVDFRKRKLYKLVSALLFVNFANFALGKHARTCTRRSPHMQE